MRGIRDKAQTNEKTASCRRVHGGHEKILGNRKGEEWMRSFQISINRKTARKTDGKTDAMKIAFVFAIYSHRI